MLGFAHFYLHWFMVPHQLSRPKRPLLHLARCQKEGDGRSLDVAGFWKCGVEDGITLDHGPAGKIERRDDRSDQSYLSHFQTM
jgi:hypothetical protein